MNASPDPTSSVAFFQRSCPSLEALDVVLLKLEALGLEPCAYYAERREGKMTLYVLVVDVDALTAVELTYSEELPS